MAVGSKSHFCIGAISLFITSLAVTGCVQRADKSTTQQREYFVRNVIDGDTIELANGRHVRYIGIDTPETMRRRAGRWEFAPEDYGVAAKEHNRALLAGKKVRLEFDVVKEDKYGRWLAYVYVDDGVMVNSEMVRGGYATLYTVPPNTKYMDVLMKAQEQARRNKRGLWANLKSISPDMAYDHIGKVRVVKGRISGIYVSPGRVFLAFEKGRGKPLKAVIFSKNLPFFTEKGEDPLKYKGRYVEVVGKIVYRDGPEIIVDNPSQIKVIDTPSGGD